MTMDETALIEWAKNAQTDALLKGGMLLPKQRHDYVGAAMVVRAALFFPNAYQDAVQGEIANCFAAYAAYAGPRLRWLTQDGRKPVQLKDGRVDPKAFRARGDAGVTAYLSSGEKAEDAGLWEFRVFGILEYEEAMAEGGASALTFSVPVPFLVAHPRAFQQLFVDFAKRLNAYSGYAGFAVNLSLSEAEANTPTEYWLARRYLALDVGNPLLNATHLRSKLKTVSWLTCLNKTLLEQVGGIAALRSELPPDWFALYDMNGGVVIQAGPEPESGGAADEAGKGPLAPANYVILNNALKAVRASTVWRLQRGLMGAAAPYFDTTAESDDWLRRFDINETDVLEYKAKLLKMPRLTSESTLADHRV
ncbi:type VI immunity family protein [Burkholderia cenocepacia]|uniref:type VI immunity family protein n=1 Tax=Burkholderia cenocepacia TaxID=95486 RepID=UPI0020117C41|nr:type VI immunity family protein [Burkholderia cenocepacia]